ncbi:MAG: histone deacetylase [Candidatus Aenigmarchaeota archaeon]|nr:histone deacetylase [Candidatus Aenigmarchaeota archaeon]
MVRTKIVFSDKCLGYDLPGHPESSKRVSDAVKFLRSTRDFKFIEPKECLREDLLSVHSKEMIDKIKHGKFINLETPALPDIFSHAKLSVGGAMLAMKTSLKEEKAFSLMRPPGHHATRTKFGGFCYFNNIAIAVTKALEKVDRVAILDIDVHHGNGTQDIFLGRQDVLFASIHQYGQIYPGTGKHSDGNCFNYSLNAYTEESMYIQKLEVALDKIKDFDPDLIAVSAGFDTFKNENIASIKLDMESYSRIATLIAKLDKPRFAVLEGGYTSELGKCIYAFLKNF